MRVTQSLFALQSWVIITPLCSLLCVGTQGQLWDRVTHAPAPAGMSAHSSPVSTVWDPSGCLEGCIRP